MVYIQNFLSVKLVLIGNRKYLGSIALNRLGTSYGGWFIPTNVPDVKQNLVVVSAGLGHDTSFDLEMIKKGWYLIGLDPLSECCDIANKNLKQQGNFEILNRGLASWTGDQIFYEPKVYGHDSYSTINVQQVLSPVAVSFPVISLEDLFAQSNNLKDADFRVMKMDIEGAELDLLLTSMEQINRFDFLAVEMDFLSLIPFSSSITRLKRIYVARKILANLENTGHWCLVWTENFNFFWSKMEA
jgi:FkbM family methyltransferase